MNSSWTTQNTFPGSVKPIYGAKYPPLKQPEADTSIFAKTDADDKFRNYAHSVSDVWDTDVSLDNDLALSSAYNVLRQHAASHDADLDPMFLGTSAQRAAINSVMPNLRTLPSKTSAERAMQRLATQRDVVPVNVQPQTSNSLGIYPKLPEVSTFANRPISLQASIKFSTSSNSKHHNSKINAAPLLPKFTSHYTKDMSRFDRLRTMLGIVSEDRTESRVGTDVDLKQLRKDCWLGIPHKIRPLAWRILSGYIPTNLDRREMVLKRKRDEYWHYVEQYFHTRYDEQHQTTFRQIHIDIPRMCPLIPLFQQKIIQEIFERILYIWAIRHPASGYVQGINDLVTPFFVVFLSEFLDQDVDIGTFELPQLPREQIELIEADSFWCFSTLLDSIQDNYTFAQPGIQRKVNNLEELISRVDRELYQHLKSNGIEFLQFSFRWMNNLLMREIPLRATIRLWDTYLSEVNGFSDFHTYVCGAFLRLWSRQIRAERDFQGIMLFLQSLPTQGWNDQQICELSADAYSLMQVFHGAKSHLLTP